MAISHSDRVTGDRELNLVAKAAPSVNFSVAHNLPHHDEATRCWIATGRSGLLQREISWIMAMG
jgi:hypothetical protein